MSDREDDRAPILLVDDEPEILHSLKGLLRREFQLFTAESGQQALEILRQHPIHVIMTDQRMPEMTGAELLGKACELSPETVRIIFTGYADIKAIVDAVNHGYLYRYVTKPWDPDELVETLQQAADEYTHRQRKKKLLDELREFLDQSLQAADNGAAELTGALREKAEMLREKIRDEVQADDAAA